MDSLAPYRDEIRRLHQVNDGLRAKVSALQDKIAHLHASHAEEIVRIKAELKCKCMSDDAVRQDLASTKEEMESTKEELAEANNEVKELAGKLKRYENSTTPGRHGYNEERAKIRAEEAQLYAEENGMTIVENHKVGPPEGHKGAEWSMDIQKIEHHEMKKCPCCGNTHLKKRKLISKAVVDFGGESRFLTVTLHKGHRMRCDTCRRTFKPIFPSISGTAFGITALGHILEYVCRKNTDYDTAYYLGKLNKHKCSPNMIWNARGPGRPIGPHTTAHNRRVEEGTIPDDRRNTIPLQEGKGVRVGGTHRYRYPGDARPGQGESLRTLIPERDPSHAGGCGRVCRV